MPRIPRPYDSPDPVLQPARSTAQIDERVAQRIGTAGHQMGNAIAAIGNAFGEVMGRRSEIEDSTNAARAKLEWYKFDNDAWSNLEQNAGEKGDGWQNAQSTYEQGRKDILSRYPVNNPQRQADLSMFLEKQVAERGFQAARAMQNQAGKYYRGIEDQEIAGATASIAENPSQEMLDAKRSALMELIEGGRGKYHSEATIEQRKRQIEGALTMGQLIGLGKADPEKLSELLGKIRAGKYEIDQPSRQRGAAQSESVQPATGGGPDYRGQSGQASIRYNNPGAMYPGPSSRKFGAVATETIGGGHKIAVFPDAVSGAAAQFDLLASKYTGQSVQSAIAKWSGGNSVGTYLQVLQREAGVDPNATLTREMVQDPRIAIPLAKAMAVQEAGRPYPLSDAQWAQAHRMAFGGASEQGQQSSPVAAVNEQGQKVTLNLAGLSADQKSAALDDAVSKGYSKFLYINDDRERVVAQQNGGQFDWQPALQKGKPFTGPAWATDVIQKNFANHPEVAQGIEAMKGALAKDPNAEVKSVVPQETLAALAQQFPDLQLPDNMTVAQAAEAIDHAVNPKQPTEYIPMGRLQGGQVFSVNSAKHGEIKVSAEAVNALDRNMLRKMHAEVKDTIRLNQSRALGVADEMVKNQTKSLEETGQSLGPKDYDHALVQGAYAKNPRGLAAIDRKFRIAQSIGEAVAYAADKPEYQGFDEDKPWARQKLEALRPSAGDQDFSEKLEAYHRASRRIDDLMKLRQTDAALAVQNDPLVRQALGSMPGGRPTNPAEGFQLADARIKAQTALGIDDEHRSPLTNAEARSFASAVRGRLGDGQALDTITDLQQRLQKLYGAYGNMAAKVVLMQAARTKDDKERLGNLLTSLELAAGRTTPTKAADKTEMGWLERLTKSYSSYVDEVTPQPVARGAQEVTDRLRGIAPPEQPPARGKPIPPPKDAIDHLKANPETWKDFEQKYNLPPGSARAFILK